MHNPRRTGLSTRRDGVSLAPLFQGKPREKGHMYCWYHRNRVREQASEHVRTARYKLYADGRFFDVQADPDEETDLAAGAVPQALQSVHVHLRQALEQHVDVPRAADAVQNAKRAKHGK